MKREIYFTQYEAEQGRATGVISIDLHDSLVEVGESVEYSANGKVLPFYEGQIEFKVTLDDGTVSTVGGTLALWYPKKHTKAAIEAAKKAKEEAAKRAKEEELKKARMELLKAFTEEQIQALTALGMLDKEGE